VPDHRADALVLVTRSDQPRELGQGQVVAPIKSCPPQPLGHPFKRGVVDPRALDEEDVQALVLLLGEQRAPSRLSVPPGADSIYTNRALVTFQLWKGKRTAKTFSSFYVVR